MGASGWIRGMALVCAGAWAAGAAPLELLRASYWGTAGEDDIEGAAVAADGTIYIAGNTGDPLAEAPGGGRVRRLGADVAEPRCGYGFVARLSADGGKVLACVQFARGVAVLTGVQVGEQGVYAGGYASEGLEPLLAGAPSLLPAYPLAEEVARIKAGDYPEGGGPGHNDPIGNRPGLGRYGAPCVLRFDAGLAKIEGGTYLEGWQQVWDKHRCIDRPRNPATGKKENLMVEREFFWQPTAVALQTNGDVVAVHDGGYFRRITDADRQLAGTNAHRFVFYDTCDWLSRLSPDLSRRAWVKPVHAPAVNPEVVREVKSGWPFAHYGNPRTHRLRAGPGGALFLCGWSASATCGEPYWAPYLWRVDPATGDPLYRIYEYDPMSGGDRRMNGNVSDTAVVSLAPEDDGDLLVALHADGGNNVMGFGPRGAEGVRMTSTLLKGGGFKGSVVHFNGHVQRVAGRTRDGLGGARTGHCAWTVDLAPLPEKRVLALGRYNGPFPFTDDAWSRPAPDASPTNNPNAFLRVYSREFDLAFSTSVPGLFPFELVRLTPARFLAVGKAAAGALAKEPLAGPGPAGGFDGYFALFEYRADEATAALDAAAAKAAAGAAARTAR